MPRTSVARSLWEDMRRFVGEDVRGFLADPLGQIRGRIDQLHDRDDQFAANATALKGRIDQAETALAGKAPSAHTHTRAEVNGLPAILTNLDGRTNSLESDMAKVKQRLGIT